MPELFNPLYDKIKSIIACWSSERSVGICDSSFFLSEQDMQTERICLLVQDRLALFFSKMLQNYFDLWPFLVLIKFSKLYNYSSAEDADEPSNLLIS